MNRQIVRWVAAIILLFSFAWIAWTTLTMLSSLGTSVQQNVMIFLIRLIPGVILAGIAGLWHKSPQLSLWTLLGAGIGSFGTLMICTLGRGILFQVALSSTGGSNTFGIASLNETLLLILLVILGGTVGGWIGLLAWFKSFPH